jgi:HD-GYP domain-containing protein (c-di-GMP phosphodiesterase class II)
MSLEFADNERAAGESFLRLAKATDEFEAYAHPHAARVAALAGELAARFRLSRADRSAIVFAALLHDVGEAAMKRDYIRRAGPLTDAERLDLQRHPVIGEQEAARAGADRAVQLLVRWHQEWWSGAGYPDALRGEQIPLGARILRVADAYAALTDARPFRPAGTESEARKHLTLWAGLEFDPQVVRSFLALEGLSELRSFARAEQASRAATNEETAAPPHSQEETNAQLQSQQETTGSQSHEETAAPPVEEAEAAARQSENLMMNAE